MASAAIQKLVDHARSQSLRLKKAAALAKVNEERMIASAGAVAVAAVAGAVDGKYGEGGKPAEVYGVPVVAALSAVGVVAGFSDWIPGGSMISQVSIGPLSYSVGNMVRDKVAG